MTVPKAPAGLAARGRKLWRGVLTEHTLAPAELILLEEACRTADRLEKLDAVLRGEVDEWVRIKVPRVEGDPVTVVIDGALAEARQQANQLKQLVASLRLPDDVSGKKPQKRGGARGAYKPQSSTGVSSLERARAARQSS